MQNVNTMENRCTSISMYVTTLPWSNLRFLRKVVKNTVINYKKQDSTKKKKYIWEGIDQNLPQLYDLVQVKACECLKKNCLYAINVALWMKVLLNNWNY